MNKENNIVRILEILKALGESEDKLRENKNILENHDEIKIKNIINDLLKVLIKNQNNNELLSLRLKKINNNFEEAIDNIKNKNVLDDLINF